MRKKKKHSGFTVMELVILAAVIYVLAAVAIAGREGLRLPIVYNTGGYDSPEALAGLQRGETRGRGAGTAGEHAVGKRRQQREERHREEGRQRDENRERQRDAMPARLQLQRGGGADHALVAFW